MLFVFVTFAYLVPIQNILMFNATTKMFKSSLSPLPWQLSFQWCLNLLLSSLRSFFSKSMLLSFCDIIFICHKVYLLNDGTIHQYWCPSFWTVYYTLSIYYHSCSCALTICDRLGLGFWQTVKTSTSGGGLMLLQSKFRCFICLSSQSLRTNFVKKTASFGLPD